MTDYEQNKKLTGPVKAVMQSMASGLDGMTSDDGAFYDNNFYFGFGRPGTGIRWAEVYISPETYEIMETALNAVLDYFNEEYPVERIERKMGEAFYYSPSGRQYIIAELTTPGDATRYDIGILLEVIPGEDEYLTEYKTVPGYVYGVDSMRDGELLDWCREITAEYEKEESK